MAIRSELVERSILILIVLAYLALGVLYAVLTPPWQVPDEPAHYNYVRHLVEKKRLPVLQMGDYDHAYLEEIKEARFAPGYAIDAIRYESHQPPMYYLLLASVYALSGGALIPLRIATALIGGALPVVAYLAGKTLYPRLAWPALGLAAFVAFIPQHIAMAAGVENDVLAELLLSIVMLRLLQWLQSDTPYPLTRHVITGVVIGLGLLTKMSAYLALPLVLVTLALKWWRTRREGQRRLEGRLALYTAAALLVPALLIGLPWLVRNAVVYGNLDVTGLRRHEQVVEGQLRTREWLAMFGWRQWPGTFGRTTVRSFWGMFGWLAVPMEWRIYLALRLFAVIAAVGLVFRAVDLWDERGSLSPGLVLLGCWGLFTLGSYLWYNLSFYQAQGRYLFPALIPIGLAWTLGLENALRPRHARWLVAVMGLVTAYDVFKLLVGTHGDKWQTLIHGLGTGYVGSAWVLPAWAHKGLLAVPYLFLAAVCAASPFWFIVPYLKP